MQIKGFIWREDVVDKLWWKHNVTIEEAEAIFLNRPRIEKIGVFRILWDFKRVMLSEAKHPRGVGILRFAQNDKTP